MKASWTAAALGDISSIAYGYTESASTDCVGPRFLRITDIQHDWVDWERVPYCPIDPDGLRKHRLLDGDIVFARTGATTGKSFLVRDPPQAVPASYLIRLRITDARVVPEFLALFFQTESYWRAIREGTSGSAQGGFNASKLSALELPLPALEEQRRVVAVLDEAFAAIATATANAEKNLVNARELFERYLAGTFSRSDAHWIEEPLNTHVRFVDYRGKTPPKREAGIRLITAKNVKMGAVQRYPEEFVDPDAYDRWMTRGLPNPGDVLFTTEAPLGNVAQLDTDEKVMIGQRLITMQPDPKRLDSTFLKYALCSAPVQKLIHEKATGATVSGIKAKLLKLIPIRYPSLADQLQIIGKLDELHSYSQDLASQNKTKLAALAALKQSLLARAFTGELTAAAALATNDNWKTPAFTAQVIALAYCRHLALGTQVTFGRVKAQKALHFCESVGGVDLGRNPIKDAAGPNDFQHMLAAEDWAKANQFFEFVPRSTGSGYSFKKLARFDAMVAEGTAALKPVQDQLERAIGLIAPMKSEGAELLATVHAAWNNLILDGVDPTDAAIIHEARENWHIAKQRFGEGKFRQAIAAIRAKGIEPDGSAKRVGGQGALLF